MRKQKKSKLDPFSEQLEEWFDANVTLEDARARLQRDFSMSVSGAQLSDWWNKRQHQRLQDRVLEKIATGAQATHRIEKQFSKDPPPELETLLKLHRVVIMQLSLKADADPALLKIVTDAMKPVMEWVKEQGKNQDRRLNRERFEFDGAKAALAHLPQLRQIAANSKLDETAKIQAVRERLFGKETVEATQ